MPRHATERLRSPGRLRRAAAAALLCVLMPAAAHALTSDHNQPVHVSADRFHMDRPNGISIYTGHVVITQGSLRLQAARVEVYQGSDGQLQKMVADGKPARFRQRPDGAEYDVTGHALHLEYRVTKHLVDLIGKAHVQQHRDQFNGQHIVYDTLKSVVEASGGNGQVHAIIAPKPQAAKPKGKKR